MAPCTIRKEFEEFKEFKKGARSQNPGVRRRGSREKAR
jgi:hypothetical protein